MNTKEFSATLSKLVAENPDLPIVAVYFVDEGDYEIGTQKVEKIFNCKVGRCCHYYYEEIGIGVDIADDDKELLYDAYYDYCDHCDYDDEDEEEESNMPSFEDWCNRQHWDRVILVY